MVLLIETEEDGGSVRRCERWPNMLAAIDRVLEIAEADGYIDGHRGASKTALRQQLEEYSHYSDCGVRTTLWVLPNG